MVETLRQTVVSACYRLMLSIVRLLVALGVSHREFSEISKRAYVQVVAFEGQARGRRKGRPLNTSRVAVVTGLTRKDVRRIKDILGSGDPLGNLRLGAADTILHGWSQDAEFRDSDGLPRVLSIDNGEISFHGLVRRFGGDLPPGAILKEMLRVGAVERVDDNRLRLVRDSFSPLRPPGERVEQMAAALSAEAGSALRFLQTPGEPEPRLPR